jgi:hypothetical protein
MPRLKDPQDRTRDPRSAASRVKTRCRERGRRNRGRPLAPPGQSGRILDLRTASRERSSRLTRPESDWDGTLMAEIGQPERQIVVRPGELPVPSELPLDPPVPAPARARPGARAGGAMRRRTTWLRGRALPRLPREATREPRRGWRVWRVVDSPHGPALASWRVGTVWPARGSCSRAASSTAHGPRCSTSAASTRSTRGRTRWPTPRRRRSGSCSSITGRWGSPSGVCPAGATCPPHARLAQAVRLSLRSRPAVARPVAGPQVLPSLRGRRDRRAAARRVASAGRPGTRPEPK